MWWNHWICQLNACHLGMGTQCQRVYISACQVGTHVLVPLRDMLKISKGGRGRGGGNSGRIITFYVLNKGESLKKSTQVPLRVIISFVSEHPYPLVRAYNISTPIPPPPLPSPPWGIMCFQQLLSGCWSCGTRVLGMSLSHGDNLKLCGGGLEYLNPPTQPHMINP